MDGREEHRRRKAAAEWNQADPDQVFDDLPEPYRTINRAIEDVLFGVDESIQTLEKQRKSSAHEFGLPQALPTSTLSFAGSTICAFTEARTGRLAIGTSLGEVTLIDSKTREVVASERPPFEEGESTCCIALSADASYQSFYQTLPRPPEQAPPKPCSKLLVCGSVTPKIFVYGLSREAYGMKLTPACAISVPAPEAVQKKPPTPEAPVGKKGKDVPPPAPVTEVEPAEVEPLPSPIQQLHAKGVSGALWIFVLSFDRTIRAYLCPLGEPESVAQKQDCQTLNSIPDVPEDEEEAGQEALPGGEEFANVVQIQTPKYCIPLPSMVPLPGLSEPSLGSITLSITRLEGAQPAQGKAASQTPTFVFLSSSESNLVFAYCFRTAAGVGELDGMTPEGSDGTAGNADIEAQVKALLAQKPPPIGELKEPSESLLMQPQRRWMLPSKICAVASSASGSFFAVGSVEGSLALISTASGPSLKTVLDGHYSAIASLAFYREEALVSVGADSWIHFYDVRRNQVIARCLLAPPPSPPPASAVVAIPLAPIGLALDAQGNLRLLDILRGEKMAKVVCRERDEEGDLGDEMVGLEEPPSRIIATANGFCAICQTRTMEMAEGSSPNSPSAIDAPADISDAVEQKSEGQSSLVFFDVTETLCRLFPGIAARVARGDTIAELLARLSKEDMLQLPGVEAPSKPPVNQGVGNSGLLRRNSTGFSERRHSQVKISTGSVTGGTSSGLGLSTKTLPPAGAEGGVAELTAENLQKINSKRNSIVAKAPSALRRGSEAGKSSMLRPVFESGATAAQQATPLNWQVSVKQNLRRCVEEKALRQATLSKRMEAIRRELECK